MPMMPIIHSNTPTSHPMLRHFPLVAAIQFAALPWVSGEDGIKDPTYNMPAAVTATMGVDDAMRKMETPVKPEVLAEFKKQHPGKFWLFGEDRQFAVRRNIVPAHWFEDGAKQFQKFSGVARPGEFYVFQVCRVPGEQTRPLACEVMFDSLKGANATVISGLDYSTTQQGERSLFVDPVRSAKFSSDPVHPVWIGLQIPKNAAPGNYTGQVLLRPSVLDNEPS